ncbi:hypothetical protein L107_05898 [Cyanobium sp. Copco_Reservoir_LC18]|uniref:hypothetical protein n=1 Tax=Cyanobium sp. Copco_Reservoir_LC18 TaxID=1328305 RepID=UPI00135792C6|nr:hypothetical protein [Cyanobium sp. Copco_Reservoir_LC18]KAF0653878.1 hypothetical protein L107_05898 [Cyanobium sp. Copco_Reservoir_LC18]
MGWDPTVLRKYNTTGHFRLINQLRSELKGNPLIRPKDGETVGAANRSKSLTRALQNRSQSGGYGRSRRSVQSSQPVVVAAPPLPAIAPVPVRVESAESQEAANARSFRERLNAIEMR